MGGVSTAASAVDELVFADDSFELCIKKSNFFADDHILTAADIPSITSADCNGYGLATQISNISGAESLTNLENIFLDHSQVVDLSPLSGLPSLSQISVQHGQLTNESLSSLASAPALRTLWLQGNTISDISPVAQFLELRWLQLNANQISNIDAVANLTKLRQIALSNNKITSLEALRGLNELQDVGFGDNSVQSIEPLQRLINANALYFLNGQNQNVILPNLEAGVFQANPVRDQNGAYLTLTTYTDGVDIRDDGWTFDTSVDSAVSLLWGWSQRNEEAATTLQFNGRVIQGPLDVGVVTPQNPVVTQATCDVETGIISPPSVTLADTPGIDYWIEGSVVPGAKISIFARAQEGLSLDNVDGWIPSGEGTLSILPLELESPDCISPVDPIDPVDPVDPIDPVDPVEPVNPVKPVDPGAVTPNSESASRLAQTGFDALVGYWAAGIAFAVGGAVLMFYRRRNPSNGSTKSS